MGLGGGGGLFGGGGAGNPGDIFGGMGLDLQMHQIPFVGGFFANPQEQFAQEQMQRAMGATAAYRPFAQEAQLNALMGAHQYMQPVSDMLAQMYGPGAAIGGARGPAYASPVNPAAYGIGAPMPQGQGGAPPAQQDQGGGGLLGGVPIVGDLPLVGGLF